MSDSTTEDVAFADFGAAGITTAPADTATLTTTDTIITLTHTGSGQTATQGITVTEPIATYAVNIPTLTNGTVTASKTTGLLVGEQVSLTIAPVSGYQLKAGTLKVMHGTTEITVTDNKFTMPAGDVTISAEFEAIPLTIAVDKASVKQGEQLTVTMKFADEYNGKTVEFWLNSDPIKLGEAVVTDGKATVTALVPCSVAAGDHTVTAVIDGVNVGTPVPVTVVEAPDCGTTAVEKPIEIEKPTTAPGTGIGSNPVVIVIAAMSLVALGTSGLLRLKKL